MTVNEPEQVEDEVVTEENLLTAVKELIRVVTALEMTLKRDYPTRLEVRRRRYQIVAAMVAAIVLSYFATIQTVAYCFLDGIPAPGDKQICSIFPGYEESFNNNRDFVGDFAKLQQQIIQNAKDIEELQNAK